MNRRLWIIFAVLVLATLGGLIWWKNTSNNESSTSYVEHLDGSRLITVDDIVTAKNKFANGGEAADDFTIDKSTLIPDHYIGNPNAKVTVIEYEDFACTACNSFAQSATKIHDDYKDKVLFIYRNFNIGQNTSALSESAAEAAFLLGGRETYWKMHDLIFSDETCVEGMDKETCRNTVIGYAKDLKLDGDKFKEALDNYADNGILAKIQRDKKLGSKAGVTATPTWFINGEKAEGASASNMRSLIDAALKQAKD